MSVVRHPQRIQSVHVESIDGDLCVYDTARQHVHALNHTAAFVWQRCDGRTAPTELAAALAAEASIADAEAVVRLTLQELAAAQLLTAPLDEVVRVSRRDLLRRGVAAAAIPVVYSIVAPTPAAAQSGAVPTLTSVVPNQGTQATTVAGVVLTGTNFIVGATSVLATGGGGGVTVNNIVVSSPTLLTANFVIDPGAAVGPRGVTVTTIGGTSNGLPFTVNPPPPPNPSTFNFTGSPASFTVPAGVVSIVINATAPAGGPSDPGDGIGGLGGRAIATVSVAPGTVLAVRVGGPGVLGAGGYNGGGGITGTQAGGGGGASDVYQGGTPLVIAGGGGGAGRSQFGTTGNGGNGGGSTAVAGQDGALGGSGGGGGSQAAGGTGGLGAGGSTNGGTGVLGTGGAGGNNAGQRGGGGGGGGFWGGGGGGGDAPPGSSGGGGGGSSFFGPGTTIVENSQGVGAVGQVIISW